MRTITRMRARSGRRRGGTQVVHFTFTDPIAHRVCVAGTFNGWNPEADEMARSGEGRWERVVALAPGTYEYRLVVDGRWITDPNADHTVLSSYGERNSLLTVS